jgi:hypothetical protein
MAERILSVVLLPQHIKPIPLHLPFLRSIQTLLNESYTKTYCAHPEIFGTTHLRLADPAQLADIVGENGFTVVLVRVTTVGANEETQIGEVVATGSVKDFGDGDVETYAQWSLNLSGSEWAAGNVGRGHDGKSAGKGQETVPKHEVTAFAVSPHCQAAGLGARVLKEIEWLVSYDGSGKRLYAKAESAPSIKGVEIRESETRHLLKGIDLDALKMQEKNNEMSNLSRQEPGKEKPKLVLMGIRELGNEAYYQRRGFKSLWSGRVPVGMWDCKQECTMVYMEKDIQ